MRRALLCLWLLMPALVRAEPAVSFGPWPQADALFHRDPRWLGGDDAYSVDLGAGRVLWLFGDSFVAERPGSDRRHALMVRNSVAVQTGYDPTRAAMRFAWGPKRSFFAEREEAWYWPGDGVMLPNHTLLLFLMKIRATRAGLGFEASGWEAAAIDDPDDDPSVWRVRRLQSPANPFGVIVGSGAVLCRDGYVYAFGAHEPGDHDACLVRWPIPQAESGDLSRPFWWTGDVTGWREQSTLGTVTGLPVPVLKDGQTEFSVDYEPALDRFVEIQTVGFGPADLVARWAERLVGPWSPPSTLYHPPECADRQLMIYAGKAHPEQQGADWALTYVANSFSAEHLLGDRSIYYPRFVRGSHNGNQRT